MKIGNEIISLKITSKRSTNLDPITQETVEKCIRIAMDAHEGQRDRDGNAVILHPLLVGSMGQTDAEKCVGFLHDVVEDTDWTFDDLHHNIARGKAFGYPDLVAKHKKALRMIEDFLKKI